MAEVDPALAEQVFDVKQGKQEPDVEYDREADHFG